MEVAASGGFGLQHRIRGQDVSDFGDEACGGECFFDVVAFEVDVGIDFVGEVVVALIFFEADVVGGGADPERVAVDFERSFPDAQVIARGDDSDGFGMRPAVILLAAEEIKRAHGHGEIGFFRDAFEEAVEDGFFDVGVDLNPAGCCECFFHGDLRADEQEVDHIAGVAGFIGDAARDFREEIIVDAAYAGHGFGGVEDGVGIGRVNLDVNRIRAVAGVAAELIDADRQAARERRDEIALRADEERLRGVSVADAPDHRAAAGLIEGQNSQKILEAASNSGRSGVGLLVGVAKNSSCCGGDVFACLHVDTGVNPERVPSELNFLREPTLA